LIRADQLAAQPDVASGVHGDPRRASAELGQIGVDAIVAQTVAAINYATARR
jgi:creatinine amidohydrolase/Fe(II)-dependent formamide hydrolase-like protein